MDRVVGRTTISLLALLISGQALAVGLGELRGQPVLGDALRLEVALIGADRQRIDASCFRLLSPAAGDDLPWLRKAAFAVRKAGDQVLEIRSDVPLREPVMQMRIQLGCGHEISRDYILMASPVRDVPRNALGGATASQPERLAGSDASAPAVRRPVRVRPVQPAADAVPARLKPAKAAQASSPVHIPDRLILSGGDAVGEPSLRLATELLTAAGAKDAQRDILRLEYRMLMALHEQASSQMAAAEKLRNMEAALVELQARAGEFAQRVEKDVVATVVPPAPAPTQQAVQSPPAAPVAPPANVVVPEQEASETPWSLYGLALGGLLGLAAWLGWRRYREGKEVTASGAQPLLVPDLRVDPKREDEREEPGGIDLPVEPAAMGMPMQVDFDIGGKERDEAAAVPAIQEGVPGPAPDSVLSINATTLDEHFEANPVMELADIMLSFGRVKGAAQALQEFIDHNPEEALQPWIRLMDVYRLAGMRAEFESVARNLNQHFNVEVQTWEQAEAQAASASQAGAEPAAPRPQSLEEMPRLMNSVVDLWASGDVIGYLYQLLRDNRGGQRQGFALPVVDDILFLIELKETANRME